MKQVLNKVWTNDIDQKIIDSNSLSPNYKPFDETLSSPLGIKYIIYQFAKDGRPFKKYNYGAGVVRITSEEDTCPCCKRRL